MIDKHWFVLFAFISTTVNGTVYGRSILRGTTKPHVFSWFVWALIVTIAFAAQMAGHAGLGAWPFAYSALMCFTVACLSLTRGEKTITRGDWLTFLGALAAIPLWLATSNPLAAIVLVTLIDALGFYPTFRKSWNKPQEENIFLFAMGGFTAGMTLLALEHYSLTTVLYPTSLALSHWALAAMLLGRRRALTKA